MAMMFIHSVYVHTLYNLNIALSLRVIKKILLPDSWVMEVCAKHEALITCEWRCLLYFLYPRFTLILLFFFSCAKKYYQLLLTAFLLTHCSYSVIDRTTISLMKTATDLSVSSSTICPSRLLTYLLQIIVQ